MILLPPAGLDQSKDKLNEIKAELKKKDEKITELSDEIDELRIKSMNKTLVLRGFPEKVEGTRDWKSCKQFVTKFIYDHFGLQVEIERAHRGSKVIRPPLQPGQNQTLEHPCLLNCSDERWQMKSLKGLPPYWKILDIPSKKKSTGLSSSSWSHRKFMRREEMHLW